MGDVSASRPNGIVKKAVMVALFVVGAYWPLVIFFQFDTVAMRDFGTFWVSGHAIRLGIDPYDAQAFKALGDRVLGTANYNFTYPPHLLFFLFPFSFLAPLPALILWNIASALLFWWAARPWMPKGMPAAIALLTPGALINFNYGQTGLICSALFLMAFRGSGVSAALLTIKPHFGFLVLPAMLRDKRAFVVATFTALGLIIASALVFGNWLEFLQHARDIQGKNLADLSQVIWMRKGTTPAIGYGFWGWAPFALGAAYFLSRNFNVFTAATATFLISPYGLHYDMAAVCLGLGIVLYTKWDRMPLGDKIALSLAFLTPVIVVYAMTWIIPPILLWALVVQGRWTEGVRLHFKRPYDHTKRIRIEVAPAPSH